MIILIIGIILVILFFSDFIIEMRINKCGKDHKINMHLKGFYGIMNYNIHIPFIDIVTGRDNIPALKFNQKIGRGKNLKNIANNKSVINLHELQNMYKKYKKIYLYYTTFIVSIQKKIIIHRIYWTTELGVGDAYETAMITGFIWMMKSYLMTALYRSRHQPKDAHINVTPNYGKENLNTSFHCIFSIKLGNIINAGLKTLIVQKRDGV